MTLKELLKQVSLLERATHLRTPGQRAAATAHYEQVLMPDLARRLKLAVESLRFLRDEDPGAPIKLGVYDLIIRTMAEKSLEKIEGSPHGQSEGRK